MVPREVIAQVLECIKMVTDVRSGISRDRLEAFRSRARDLPSTMFINGFAYALTYIASRSTIKTIELGLLAESCNDLLTKLVEHIKNVEREEAGYIMYGSILAFLIKQAGLSTAKSFDELLRAAMEDVILSQGALVLAEWIKRLAEAYISS